MKKNNRKNAFDFYKPQVNDKDTKKNSRKNAFDFYKLQFDQKNDKGFYDTAYDSWMRMTLQQREPFEDLARESKRLRQKVTPANPLSETRDQEHAEKTKIVNELVKNSFQSNNHKTQEYFFIAANAFVKTMLNKYYPAELALIKFTLQDGVIRTFHTFVNPENIPIGYRFDAINESNNTHQLPIPPNAKGETDYALIFERINEFIGNMPEFIPLFTTKANIQMIESLIEEFSDAAEITCDRYKVLPLDQLFFDLKEQSAIRSAICGTRGFKCIDEATNQLNLDKYVDSHNIACQFHDENDCINHCCLSVVKRWAYTISEIINLDLNIPLVAGKHFPSADDVPSCTSKDELKLPACQAYGKYRLDIGFDPNYPSADDVLSYTSKDELKLPACQAYGNYRLDIGFDPNDSYHAAYDTNSTFNDNYQEDLNSSISTNFTELEQRREADESLFGHNFGLLRLHSFGRGRRMEGTGQNQN